MNSDKTLRLSTSPWAGCLGGDNWEWAKIVLKQRLAGDIGAGNENRTRIFNLNVML